ncbi:MAG: MFS transporter [Candidatus Verstraetearchaeota archaeon]|nr:MFS transporter [Candidatus Verstraetearchaeota archaeon]
MKKIIVLFMAFITTLFTFGTMYSFGILLPIIINEFELTKFEAGLIIASNSIAYAIFAPIISYLADRKSEEKVIIIFLAITGIGTLLMGFSNNKWIICLSYAIMGAGLPAAWAPLISFLQKSFGRKIRGTVIGIMSSGDYIGYGLFSFILPLLVYNYGWRFCWYILGIFILIITIINKFVLKHEYEEYNNLIEPKVNYHKIFKIKNFWIIGISYMLMAFTITGPLNFIVTYANLEIGISYSSSAALSGIIAFNALIGTLILPLISDITGRKIMMIICNISLGLCVFAIPIVGSYLRMIIILSAIFGIFYGGFYPIYAASGSDYFPKNTTTVLGLWGTLHCIGLVIGSSIFGLITDITQSFHTSFYISALFGIIATILLIPLRKS